MKKQNKQNGITLVALVITIIILLILAGISIQALTNTGLFAQAENAKRESEIANIKEQISLDIYEKQLEPPVGSITEEQLETILGKYGTVNKEDGTIVGITTEKGYEILLSDIYSGTTTGEQNPTEKTPLENAEAAKPAGATITVTDASQGIVMVDSKKNEWVWVEVPISVTAGKTTDSDIETALKGYATDYREGSAKQGCSWTDEWYDGCGMTETEYNTAKSKMLQSIKTNGGFWISRYEAGIKGSDTDTTKARTESSSRITDETISTLPEAVSQVNMIPYNYVYCSEAQALAKKMSTDTSKTSSLLFGIQWDLVCKFLQEKGGLSVTEIKGGNDTTGSTNWGNYSNSSLILARGKYNTNPGSEDSQWLDITAGAKSGTMLLTTGALEQTNKMNIYDFAGNEYEWTLEHATSNTGYPCARRGGCYFNFGSYFPASYRYDDSTTLSNNNIGFRSALY